MVSRSEIDMKRIKDEYKKNYGKALYQDILVSKHLTTDNDNKPTLGVRVVQVFTHIYTLSFLSFRMTLKETMRRFCLRSVGVKTNSQSMRSRLIRLKVQQQVQLWKITYNLLTHIVPYALVEN